MKSLLLPIIVTALVAGCGGSKNGSGAKSGRGSGKLGRIEKSDRCVGGKDRQESMVDLNQDNVPDVRKIYQVNDDGHVLICREADLNFDGTKDLFVFFDPKGQITRDEVDLDFNGKVDIISTYAKGKVIKQEIDTNSDGRVDRLRFLEKDVPVRVEGDMDGDERVDYWEYYEAGKLVRIGVDEDGDGRADNWSRDDETEAEALSENKEEEEPKEEAVKKEERDEKEEGNDKPPADKKEE